MSHPVYWEEAKAQLSAEDGVLGGIIQKYNGTLQTRGDAFTTLARSIVGQQISVKAAASVWGKFETAAGEMQPQAVLKLNEDDLRGCGLSRQKVKYLTGIARGFEEGIVHPGLWQEMDDEAIIAELTKLPGIGRWTAEMFLIFHLLRPDVLPLGDLGVLKAFEVHYDQPREKLEKHARIWQPYRTVASWYLWRSLDPEPVAY